AAATATAVRAARGAAEAARTLFAGTGLVDDDRPAFERLAVHAVDRGLRFRGRAHFHEAEALGTAGLAVPHYLGRGDGAELREGLVQRLVADAIGQVAYVKFVSHWGSPFQKRKTMWSFNPA